MCRSSNCAVTQDPKASTVGNYLRLKVCEKSIDTACSKGFPFCCDAENQSCNANAVGDEKATLECAKAHMQCVRKGR